MNRVHVLGGLDASKSFEVGNVPIHIGRSHDNDLVLRDRFVSRKHLKVYCQDKKCFIEDLVSKNGTFVNGDLIEPGREVQVDKRDLIMIGMSLICIGDGNSTFMKAYQETLNALKAWEGAEKNETLSLKTGLTGVKHV